MSSSRGGRLLFRPNQPQFFRIIFADSLLQHKLAIPRSFARNYGNKLPGCLVLKVPSGQKWKIGIVKAGGEVWLKEGWQRFVEYYSIAVGTFLVFQFDDSDCSFCVSIFDSSTTEIDYPYQVEASRVSEEAEQTSTQVPAETNPSRKRKEKTQVFSAEPPRKMSKVESSSKLEKGTNPEAKKATGEEKGKATDHKARSTFDSQNNSFVIVMRPSYVNLRSNVEIPRPFARKYLREKKVDAVICDLEGRTWPVQYHTNMIKGTTKISRLSWRNFVKDCLLRVGDVCMFELVDPAKNMLRVVISRRSVKPVPKSPKFNIPAAKKPIPPNRNTTEKEVELKGKSPLSSSQPLRKIKVENIPKKTGRVSNPEAEQEQELEQKPPFPAAKKLTSLFDVVVRPTHLDGKGCVHLPWNFVVKLDRRAEDVKLQIGNRVWRVKLLIYPTHRKGLLSGGWQAFARENCLKLGDVCYFELIDMKSMVIKVIISRAVL